MSRLSLCCNILLLKTVNVGVQRSDQSTLVNIHLLSGAKKRFCFLTVKREAVLSPGVVHLFQMQLEFQQQLGCQTVSLKEEHEDQQLLQVSLIPIVCPEPKRCTEHQKGFLVFEILMSLLFALVTAA